jgi:hypothetical protein
MGEGRVMRYEITPRVRELLEEFRMLSEDLQLHWLHGASEEARSEWESFRGHCPTDLEVRRGLIGRSESEPRLDAGQGPEIQGHSRGAFAPPPHAHFVARPSI